MGQETQQFFVAAATGCDGVRSSPSEGPAALIAACGSGYKITLLFKDNSLGKYRLGTSPNTLRKTLVKALGLL